MICKLRLFQKHRYKEVNIPRSLIKIKIIENEDIKDWTDIAWYERFVYTLGDKGYRIRFVKESIFLEGESEENFDYLYGVYIRIQQYIDNFASILSGTK